MSEAAKGVWAMAAACTVWGLSPIYFGFLTHVPAPEILSYRAIWSLVFFVAVLVVQRRLGDVVGALAQPRQAGWIALAGVVIALNWLGFIHAIGTGRATEASLGYYVFPLVAVTLGGLVLKERLLPSQWVSVGLAVLAVIVLTVGQGAAPWIALGIAASFGAYGLIKAQLALGPVVSVTA